MTDAHNHLQDSRFDNIRSDIIASMREVGVTRCVVNGTQPNDWPSIADLAQSHPDLIIPSFGLHPWYATDTIHHPDWLEQLTRHLKAIPNACIGECGLDRMLDILQSTPLPACGFLLHSYNGSAELIRPLAKLGAYFSYSGSIFHPNKEKSRSILKRIPSDRLLVETDAPDMLPPQELITHPLPEGLNHPANLPMLQQQTAQILDTAKISDNFNRIFESPPKGTS